MWVSEYFQRKEQTFYLSIRHQHRVSNVSPWFLFTLQWRNRRRWGGGRGQSALRRLRIGKFLLTYREKGGKEKWKRGGNGEDKKENCRQMEGGKSSKMRNERGLFFFVLFCFDVCGVCVCGGFVLFCFCICFVFVFVLFSFVFVLFFFFFACHFSKRQKFVLGLPKWKFSTGKKHFTPGKKSGKMTLPPQKNVPVTHLLRCLSATGRNLAFHTDRLVFGDRANIKLYKWLVRNWYWNENTISNLFFLDK